jgi:glycosyltransferase involved in cell wall biosynthesis
MNPSPSSTLLVATYNWPEALGAILKSVARQTVRPGEVIVADDGSGPPTRHVVESMRARLPMPVRHVWQPDDGFRAGQIRNKAVAIARGEYVLQIDGDMVLHPRFVEDHLAAARPGRFIGGSRVVLGPEATQRLVQEGSAPGLLSPGVRNRLNALRLPALGRALATVVSPRSLRSIRGCNMSYWREDFVAVNGYDEAYVGWGREDTDLVLRFRQYGLERTFFKLQGIAYHLYHREQDRGRLDLNDELLRRAAAGASYRCAVGVSQYVPPPAA